MNSELMVSALVGLVAAIIGAVVVVVGRQISHRRELERTLAAKRRDITVQFLIDAYRRLEYASNRSDDRSVEKAAEIERTFADIQLFGSPQLVDAVQATASEWAKGGGTSLTPLLTQLRQSLRSELNLDEVSPRVVSFRLGGPAQFPFYDRTRH